ncbi:hypothetical protein CANCADRAFT_13939, partial [Tortispora caseinolytica NRRL Y-17796]
GNLTVTVRARPLNSRELSNSDVSIVQTNSSNTITLNPVQLSPNKTESQRSFQFDKVYINSGDTPDNDIQLQIFNDLGVPLVNNAFAKFNNCIFAYGQTGSGKTHTMMGTKSDPGLIPRICQFMFQQIDQQPHQCSLEVSYFEIYNERVNDLLNPRNTGSLRVREHPSLGTYVEDLSKVVASSYENIMSLMDEGNKVRTVGATNMNDTSSRSHAVFSMILTQRVHETDDIVSEHISRINLVDLAGSERVTLTGATGLRFKEGTEINKSLSALGRVISLLAERAKQPSKKLVIPYRDSVLTWLLKDSLGGNSLTAMIANISASSSCYFETLSTLRYASFAKTIQNHPVKNEDPSTKLVRELKRELELLKSQLTDASQASDQTLLSLVQADGSSISMTKEELLNRFKISEKLLEENRRTMEERLALSKKIQAEREAALEEMGIHIDKDAIAFRTPQKFPHIINLSQDELFNECLLYNIKPGVTFVINDNNKNFTPGENERAIRLFGPTISHVHARFENKDNNIILVPEPNCEVFVGDEQISGPTLLPTGSVITFGEDHLFRFNNVKKLNRTDAMESTPVPSRRRLRKSLLNESPVSTGDLTAMSDTDLNNLVEQLHAERMNREKKDFPNSLKSPETPRSSFGFDYSSQPPEMRSHGLLGDYDLVRKYILRWKSRRYMLLLESIIRSTGLLKSVVRMTSELGLPLDYQFAVAISPHEFELSAYDEANTINENSFSNSASNKFPLTAIRVTNTEKNTVRLWTLDRLEHQLKKLGAIHQYKFRSNGPAVIPTDGIALEDNIRYSMIGFATVPIVANLIPAGYDFSCEVLSAYIFQPIGLLKLHIGSSDTGMIAQSREKGPMLNVALECKSLRGIAEHEYSDVHVSFFVKTAEEEKPTRLVTERISGFSDKPILFSFKEAVSISPLLFDAEGRLTIEVLVHADITRTHIERLHSWDSMQLLEKAVMPFSMKPRSVPSSPLVEENQTYATDTHTSFSILELGEDGEYSAVDIIEDEIGDTFLLHQGMQRRFVLKVTYPPLEGFEINSISGVKVSNIRLVNNHGMILAESRELSGPKIELSSVSKCFKETLGNGSERLKLVVQWDSSVHNLPFLNKATKDKCNILMDVEWNL